MLFTNKQIKQKFIYFILNILYHITYLIGFKLSLKNYDIPIYICLVLVPYLISLSIILYNTIIIRHLYSIYYNEMLFMNFILTITLFLSVLIKNNIGYLYNSILLIGIPILILIINIIITINIKKNINFCLYL